MPRGERQVVSGFVVKVEEVVPTPPGITTLVVRKLRKEVSRVFHSRSAAEHMMALLKKANPDGDYYIHEKTTRHDTGTL